MAHEPSDEHRARLRSLQALALNTSTVLWHAAPDGTVLQPNPSWEAFTGQDYAAYAGWNWVSAIHPDDRAACIDAWRAATRDRTLFEHRYRLLRRDGSYRAMQVQGTPVLEGGTLREWVGVCVDITEQLQAQSALRESEAVFRFLDRLGQATRQLTEAADVMQATARLLGEHLGATRCAYADVEPDGDTFTIRSDWSMPGVPSSAGMYSLQLFGPQAVERLHRGEHLVVRDVDRELGSEGGGRMFNAIGIQAIICAGLVKQGRLVAMMAVHQAAPRDWTEREIALVEEVVDRCWAHIERVRDAAMLREQDRRKDLFLATLAHELRNPLAPVKYALEILRRADDPDKVQRARDAIDRQVTQMARLIDDLLDLSRINRGLIRLQPRPQALGALLQEALDAVQPAIEAARHTLRFVPPADDVVVDADATRMVQVFGNLLGNAAKYTPEGGTITVDVAADAHAVLVEISDTGLGIPAGQEQRVFGMFEQLEHTAAHAKGGLGIGLALARTLVELHGGEIGARSAGLGRGATFSVRLPRAAAHAAAAAPPPPAAQGRPAPLRIALVEDNEDGRASLENLLQLAGHHVESAGDGAAGLELVVRLRPDVVLLDLGLPVLDGIEVARRIRRDTRLGGALLVALTGWGAESDRRRTSEAGFDLHMTKPVEPQDLLRAIQSAAALRNLPSPSQDFP